MRPKTKGLDRASWFEPQILVSVRNLAGGHFFDGNQVPSHGRGQPRECSPAECWPPNTTHRSPPTIKYIPRYVRASVGKIRSARVPGMARPSS